MKRSFTMFPHLMTVVGSYMHPVGQAAGRPICSIEEAFAFALSRDLFFVRKYLHFHIFAFAFAFTFVGLSGRLCIEQGFHF